MSMISYYTMIDKKLVLPCVNGEGRAAGLILWDFDGTLTQSHPMWRRSFAEAFNAESGRRKITWKEVPFLPRVFLWDHWDEPHVNLSHPEAYWEYMAERFEPIHRKMGLNPAQARRAARGVRDRVLDHRSYRLFPETRDILDFLRGKGWRQAVLSNHVPELPLIIRKLGLESYFEAVISSGSAGYEKPHPGIFHAALERLKPKGAVWMVGDNLIADALGARDQGIPSILVRKPAKEFSRKVDDLWGVLGIILGS